MKQPKHGNGKASKPARLCVALDADLTAWARAEARRRGLTFSGFVRGILEERMGEERAGA